MPNPDRLQFAVHLATVALEDARAGDVQNLRDDLMDFVIGGKGGAALAQLGGISAAPLDPPLPGDYTLADFRALQAEVRSILDALVGQRSWTVSDLKTTPLTVRKSLIVSSDGASAYITVTGATRDIFLEQLFHLLAREPSDRIRPCPECGRLFFRVRRQLNCGRSCTLAISNRNRYAPRIRTKPKRRPRR